MAIDIETLKAKLEEERQRLAMELGQQSRLQDYGEGMGSEGAGYGTHMAEHSTDTYEKEQRLSLENNLRTNLGEVERALHRIETGAFGLCESCRQPIEEERLEALPYACCCLFCTERHEARHRPA
ncbi:MAG TPA: TraR/DksA C4-type zinc finger protein [Dehalococcoidia bacterium]|nr:TraR/DksA C4-type zinc finger protein [Dehalococcoidia bacterium]